MRNSSWAPSTNGIYYVQYKVQMWLSVAMKRILYFDKKKVHVQAFIMQAYSFKWLLGDGFCFEGADELWILIVKKISGI